MTLRKPRATTTLFSCGALVDAWAPLAKLKDAGFAFDGSDYPVERRGRAVSMEGLARHCAPLTALLRLAPTGFPSLGRLRQALETLHWRFNIFGPCADASNISLLATLASDRWRIQCKDVYRLALRKMSGTPPPPELAQLVSMIQCESHATSPRDSPPAAAPKACPVTAFSVKWPSFDGLDDDVGYPSDTEPDANDDEACTLTSMEPGAGDDEECTLISMHCKCSLCTAKVIDIPSDGEEAAMSIPSAAKGGQAKETKPASERSSKNEAAPASDQPLTKRVRVRTKGAASRHTCASIEASSTQVSASVKSKHVGIVPGASVKSTHVAIVQRKAGAERKGIYLMQNNKYVVGCASDELEHLKIVADMTRKRGHLDEGAGESRAAEASLQELTLCLVTC